MTPDLVRQRQRIQTEEDQHAREAVAKMLAAEAQEAKSRRRQTTWIIWSFAVLLALLTALFIVWSGAFMSGGHR